jgi:DNA-binding winged helix-turn-helix (wHTH) protein
MYAQQNKWKEQEAARAERASQAAQAYKRVAQEQTELNSLERAIQRCDLSFDEVSDDAASCIIKTLSAGGYTLNGKSRTDQEAGINRSSGKNRNREEEECDA